MSEYGKPNKSDKHRASYWLAFFCLATFSPILNFIVELIILRGGTWGFGILLIPYLLPSVIAPIYILIKLAMRKRIQKIVPIFGLSYNLILLIATFSLR